MTKEELRAWRVASGMTRTELAAYLGVSFWTLAQWETGRRAISMDEFSLRFALDVADKARSIGAALPVWRKSRVGPELLVIEGGAGKGTEVRVNNEP